LIKGILEIIINGLKFARLLLPLELFVMKGCNQIHISIKGGIVYEKDS